MPKCRACSAEVTFAVNLDTNKRVPLVPFDPEYPKAVRYRIKEVGAATYCKRDDEGPWMSHFANCTAPHLFSKGNKKSS